MINSKILRYISRKDSTVLIFLKIFLSGFNMLVSLMIQIGLESIYGRKNNYLFFILTGLIIGSVVYSLCYYQNSILLEKTKKKIMEKISLELMESYLKSEGNSKPGSLGFVQTILDKILKFSEKKYSILALNY